MQCNLDLEVSHCGLFTSLSPLFPLMEEVVYQGVCGVDAPEERIPKKKKRKRQRIEGQIF